MYIGPGAGFAFFGSLLTLATSLSLAVFSLVTWPFRMLWLIARGRKGYRRARVKKAIFLGLDGFDPNLAERFMAEGKLPNLSKLAAEGSYRRLRTTFPALSPVAWSTFATGVNPAKHNIFDFLNRDLKSYVPELSSSRVRPAARVLKLGRWSIPLSRPLCRVAPQEHDVLEDPWRARDREHNPARANHLPSRGIQWTASVRDVHARPSRYAGEFLIFQHTPGARRGRRRQPVSASAGERRTDR